MSLELGVARGLNGGEANVSNTLGVSAAAAKGHSVRRLAAGLANRVIDWLVQKAPERGIPFPNVGRFGVESRLCDSPRFNLIKYAVPGRSDLAIFNRVRPWAQGGLTVSGANECFVAAGVAARMTAPVAPAVWLSSSATSG